MKRNRPAQILSLGALALCISLRFGAGADSSAPQPPSPSLLTPIAFLVDGTWTGKLPAGPNGSQASIEMQFAWAANHHAIRFDSYFVQDEKHLPYTSGIYAWDPAKRKIAFWYTDSDGSLHQGTVTSDGPVLVQDFTIAAKDGKITTARSRLTQPEKNVFINEISVQKEGDWQKIAAVRYQRSSLGQP